MSKKRREVEEVVKDAKNGWVSGGGKKASTGQDNTGGVTNRRITKKKRLEAKESGGPRAKDRKVPVVEIVKAGGGEGKENISAVVLAAKADDEKPSTPLEVPVVKKTPSALRRALVDGKGKKVAAVGLSIGEVLKTDDVINGRVIKKATASPAQPPAKAKTSVRTVGRTSVPALAPAVPVTKS